MISHHVGVGNSPTDLPDEAGIDAVAPGKLLTGHTPGYLLADAADLVRVEPVFGANAVTNRDQTPGV